MSKRNAILIKILAQTTWFSHCSDQKRHTLVHDKNCRQLKLNFIRDSLLTQLQPETYFLTT